MSPALGTLPAPLNALRERLVGWWRALAPRDRRLARIGALALGALLVWSVGIQPALRTLRDAPTQIERLDAELLGMQRLAAESRTLRGEPPIPQAQASAALKAAAGRLGERARWAQQGDRVTLTLQGVDAQTLANLLAEARAGARARPIEAQLVRGAKGYDGTLVLSLGGTG